MACRPASVTKPARNECAGRGAFLNASFRQFGEPGPK
jgi:hypothetical protein